jgi:hypothetical protein
MKITTDVAVQTVIQQLQTGIKIMHVTRRALQLNFFSISS